MSTIKNQRKGKGLKAVCARTRSRAAELRGGGKESGTVSSPRSPAGSGVSKAAGPPGGTWLRELARQLGSPRLLAQPLRTGSRTRLQAGGFGYVQSGDLRLLLPCVLTASVSVAVIPGPCDRLLRLSRAGARVPRHPPRCASPHVLPSLVAFRQLCRIRHVAILRLSFPICSTGEVEGCAQSSHTLALCISCLPSNSFIIKSILRVSYTSHGLGCEAQ